MALPRHTSTDHVQALLYTSILWDCGDGWMGVECIGGGTSGRGEVECTAGIWLCVSGVEKHLMTEVNKEWES